MKTFFELLKIEKNEYYFDELLKCKDIVPFLGAGVTSEFFPLWGEMLKSKFTLLEDEQTIVDDFVCNGKYEEAASYLSYINEVVFIDTIKDIFDDRHIDVSRFSMLIKTLPELAPNLIITTNLDRTIERSYEFNGKSLDVYTPDFNDQMNDSINSNNRCLIKLHGSVEESSKYILTKEQYDRAYGVDSENNIDFTKPFLSNLGRVMSSRTLLFIGSSLKSDRTLHILNSIITHFNKHIKHYAFLQLDEDKDNNIFTQRKLANLGIRVIWFPKGEFSAIDLFVTNLIKKN